MGRPHEGWINLHDRHSRLWRHFGDGRHFHRCWRCAKFVADQLRNATREQLTLVLSAHRNRRIDGSMPAIEAGAGTARWMGRMWTARLAHCPEPSAALPPPVGPGSRFAYADLGVAIPDT